MLRPYSIVAAVLLIAAASTASAQTATAASEPVPVSFTVFMGGVALGSEDVTVTASADGWRIKATGRLGAPVNLSTAVFEVRYDRDWKPLSLEIDATSKGQPYVLRTAFANGKATSEIMQAGQERQKTDAVSADPIILPNMFFAGYEALALRLAGVKPGAQLHAYIAPQVEVTVGVNSVGDERIQTAARAIAAKRYALTFMNPGSNLPVEVWVDENSRLLRFRVPAQSVEVARTDVAAVSSRVERLARQSDEQVKIPAAGFTIAGTVSRPAPASSEPVPARLPAVVLVPGSGQVDRDENVAGVPIYAQLANALADAGFLVVRYDKRGFGQSGGRDESASIGDFSDDAQLVVKFLERLKDVDSKRIAILGRADGGFIAMQAAADEKKKIAAVVLIATPGIAGSDFVLEQQQRALDKMTIPDAEKQQRIELQRKINTAVIGGGVWDGIPAAYRRQAETAWFRSFLAFDPAKVMKKVVQPTLILHGSLDQQVTARHGPLLADQAKARKNNPGSDLTVIEGINHLLVPAVTGDPGEYQTLQDKMVSEKLTGVLISWLKDKLHVDAASPRR